MRTRWMFLLVAASFSLASCGGDDEPSADSGAEVGTDPTGEAAESGAEDEPDAEEAIDLSDVDPCSLIDEAKVQELTGSKEKFLSQGGMDGCFWASPVRGVGAYVEIKVARADELGTGSPVGDCPGSPIAGVGEAARGGTCPGTQLKVYVIAYDRGVRASVLVNDPERPLTPADLVATASGVFAKM